MCVDNEHGGAFVNYVASNGYEGTWIEDDFNISYECTAASPERRILMKGGYEIMPVERLFYDSNFTSDLCFITWNKAYTLFLYKKFIRRQ